jgi:phosphohistidine phosphatase
MQLYLVQHGEAKAREQDPNRPLSDKGARDVRKAADFIKPLGLEVRAVWHSGKTRARQTADILASAVSAEEGVLQRDGLAPMDDVEPVARDVGSSKGDLMIVGHLPFLGKLASRLLTADEQAGAVAFQMGGIVCVERTTEHTWRLRWMVTPELLK